MALKEIGLGNVRGPAGPTGAKGASMRLKGAWSSSIAYVNDGNYIDLVTSGGNTYACKKSNTNQAVSNTTYWELIAQKGATGPQGQPGLTDEERKLIQAWENFKANGGDIGGAITALGLNGPSSCAYAFGSGNLQLKNGEARIDFIAGDGSKPPRLEPLTGGDYDLGDPAYYYKDVWVGPYSKNSNGYNKLTNGMIYQWGQVDVTMSQANNGAITVTFPTAFTTSIRSFGAICSGNSFGWGNSDIIVGNAGCSNNDIRWSCSTRNGSNVNGKAQVTWWALGY